MFVFLGCEVALQCMTLHLFMAQVFQEEIDVGLVMGSLEKTRKSRGPVERDGVVRAGTFEMFAIVLASVVLAPALSETARSPASKTAGKDVTEARGDGCWSGDMCETFTSVTSYNYELQGLSTIETRVYN